MLSTAWAILQYRKYLKLRSKVTLNMSAFCFDYIQNILGEFQALKALECSTDFTVKYNADMIRSTTDP